MAFSATAVQDMLDENELQINLCNLHSLIDTLQMASYSSSEIDNGTISSITQLMMRELAPIQKYAEQYGLTTELAAVAWRKWNEAMGEYEIVQDPAYAAKYPGWKALAQVAPIQEPAR